MAQELDQCPICGRLHKAPEINISEHDEDSLGQAFKLMLCPVCTLDLMRENLAMPNVPPSFETPESKRLMQELEAEVAGILRREASADG